MHRATTSSETRGVKVATTKERATIMSYNADLGEVREEFEAEYSSDPIAGVDDLE
jgi:hypothetical protein